MINSVHKGSCGGACGGGAQEPFPFTMAFQPIVDVVEEKIFAYEALVRGLGQESAGYVLSQVDDSNRYAFDQNCRVKAINLAARLGVAQRNAKLSLNFMPEAIYNPVACIQTTLDTARACQFPVESLIFELTEDQRIRDRQHLSDIFSEYRRCGFQMAIDDFGAGFAGLNLLADFSADILKLDMELIRGLDHRPVAHAIVRSMVQLCSELKTMLVAEGVETCGEYQVLRNCGVRLMQGYLFARPMFEGLPEVTFPKTSYISLQNMLIH